LEPICIRFSEFGIPQNVLRVENKKIESPRRGEVLVRMIVRPINPSDLTPITGAYSHRISLPGIPGYEGVGIVEEVGTSVSQELIVNVFCLYEGKVLGKNLLKHQQNW
jgi:NADPH:quinone reductase-like Zn-dependent oxidoreductase